MVYVYFLRHFNIYTQSCTLYEQCNSSNAVELFDAEITLNKSMVAVVGCGCPTVTEAVARRRDIPVVSWKNCVFY